MNTVLSQRPRRRVATGLAAVVVLSAPLICRGQNALTPFAGAGPAGFSGDGGPANSARLSLYAFGLAADGDGNIYIADLGNYRVRKVNAGGTISTIAGNGTPGTAGDGGPALSAQLFSTLSVSDTVQGMAVDSAGNLYISDNHNHRVRKVTPAGVISNFAGSGLLPGDDGPAARAGLSAPTGVALDTAGNVYIADSLGGRVRKVDPAGIITTVAGNGLAFGSLGDGGPAAGAHVNPLAVAVDTGGNLYISDPLNGRIRKVNNAGIITTVAGNGTTGSPPSGDGGPATSAVLFSPGGVAVDTAGNLYFTDFLRVAAGGERPAIRKVDTAGIISTIASASGNISLSNFGDIVVDRAGNIYVTGTSIVYKISGVASSGPPPPPAGPVIKTVSAASLQDGPVAAESNVITTGPHLATGTANADIDSPATTLSGTTVSITDANGSTLPALVLSVTPTQVTYQIPAGTAVGTATVTITAGDGVATSGQVQIASVSPGVYTLNGAGLVKAFVLRVSNGNQIVEDVYDVDPTGAVVARPITISNGDQVYLIAYGTGFRAAGTGGVTVTVGADNPQVLYAGPQGVAVGVDQFNILIPPDLATGGPQSVPIVLTAGGQSANTVNLTVK
jgi:uncharacterized protein (TIGR03437 family)